jgi:hypothetical protein
LFEIFHRLFHQLLLQDSDFVVLLDYIDQQTLQKKRLPSLLLLNCILRVLNGLKFCYNFLSLFIRKILTCGLSVCPPLWGLLRPVSPSHVDCHRGVLITSILRVTYGSLILYSDCTPILVYCRLAYVVLILRLWLELVVFFKHSLDLHSFPIELTPLSLYLDFLFFNFLAFIHYSICSTIVRSGMGRRN